MDGQPSVFLSGLQKLQQRAKKCIELRGEYVEYIPSLVAVACFLPGQAKDSSAPPCTVYLDHIILYVSLHIQVNENVKTLKHTSVLNICSGPNYFQIIQRDLKRWTQFCTPILSELYMVYE